MNGYPEGGVVRLTGGSWRNENLRDGNLTERKSPHIKEIFPAKAVPAARTESVWNVIEQRGAGSNPAVPTVFPIYLQVVTDSS